MKGISTTYECPETSGYLRALPRTLKLGLEQLSLGRLLKIDIAPLLSLALCVCVCVSGPGVEHVASRYRSRSLYCQPARQPASQLCRFPNMQAGKEVGMNVPVCAFRGGVRKFSYS